MSADFTRQPCPHCARPIVLVAEQKWLHLGTWRTQCGPPELAWLEAEVVGTTQVLRQQARHPDHISGDDPG